MREGMAKLRELKQARGIAVQRWVEELEDVLDHIHGADNWRKRLAPRLNQLKCARTREVLKTLVDLGCVPDELLYCLQVLREAESRSANDRTRLTSHRRQVRVLAAQLEQLAKAWSKAIDSELLTPGAYGLSTAVADFLWTEAQRIKHYLEISDPRSRHARTQADWVRFKTMNDVKAITGSYYDDMIAALVSEVFRVTAEGQRRWRSRETAKWNSWKPPARRTDLEYPKLLAQAPLEERVPSGKG